MGDTGVYILRNMLEPWSSPETFRQRWKKLTSCQCSFWLWGFLLFFPPSRTAFESRFCYANGFLPAAAELSMVGARKEPADTARKASALFPAAHQAQQHLPSLRAFLARTGPLLVFSCLMRLQLSPYVKFWRCITVPCRLCKDQCIRAKDSVPIWNGICVQMKGCLP